MVRQVVSSALGLVVTVILSGLVCLQLLSFIDVQQLAFDGCSPYCEGKATCVPHQHVAGLRQPLNSYSSLAYIAAAYLALLWYRRSGFLFALAFAVTTVALGTGSFLFHATLTRSFRWLDVVGMYASLCSLVFYGLYRVAHLRTVVVFGGWATAIAGLAWYKWSIDTTLWTFGLVGIVGFCLVWHGRKLKWSSLRIHAPLYLLALGWSFRELDVAGCLCQPHSQIYQGHALWHLLTAAALALAWRNLSVTSTVCGPNSPSCASAPLGSQP